MIPDWLDATGKLYLAPHDQIGTGHNIGDTLHECVIRAFQREAFASIRAAACEARAMSEG